MPAPVSGTVWTIEPRFDPSGGTNVSSRPESPVAGARTSTRSLFSPTSPGASDTSMSICDVGSTIVSTIA